jgi:hypothetical protein
MTRRFWIGFVELPAAGMICRHGQHRFVESGLRGTMEKAERPGAQTVSPGDGLAAGEWRLAVLASPAGFVFW